MTDVSNVTKVTPEFISQLNQNFHAIDTALDLAVSKAVDNSVSLPGALNEKKGTDIASAATINLGVANGNYITITGTTTIAAFDIAAAGMERILRFTGALTITHNSSFMILPNGRDIQTAAGDIVTFRSEGSGNWRCVSYVRPTLMGLSFPALLAIGVDFNSANTDTAIPVILPPGHTRFLISSVRLYGASGTLTSATFGVFTAASGGGTAVVASGTAGTISTASADTNQNAQTPAIVNGNTQAYGVATVPTLYFRVQTAQGAARTANVLITVAALP